MRKVMLAVVTLAILLTLVGCSRSSEISSRPVSEKGEKLYDLKGTITAVDSQENAITVDHQAIPGFMEAMTMAYPVRGVKVEQLPPKGSKITAKLHVTDSGGYWLSDVRLTR
jgi:protein SCO1/2